MALTTQESADLRAEIVTDPTGQGYGTYVNPQGEPIRDDWQAGLFGLLNDSESGGDRVDHEPISSSHFRQSIVDPEELGSISVQMAATLDFYLGQESVDIASNKVQTALLVQFDVERFPKTRANIVASRTRQARRIEVILGRGRIASLDDIAQALGR